jgi:hypothetical protein
VLRRENRVGVQLDFIKRNILAAKSTYALLYASTRLKDDKEFMLAAVTEYPRAFLYASTRLKDDKELPSTTVMQENRVRLSSGSEILFDDL